MAQYKSNVVFRGSCTLIDNEYSSLLFFALFLHVEPVAKSSEVRVGKILKKISLAFYRYLCHCGKKQIECGLTWCVHNILTIVMTRIVVDKIPHQAKPHSICYLSPSSSPRKRDSFLNYTN